MKALIMSLVFIGCVAVMVISAEAKKYAYDVPGCHGVCHDYYVVYDIPENVVRPGDNIMQKQGLRVLEEDPPRKEK